MRIEGNKLTADDGMMLTNGETVAGVVYLASGAVPADWREVTAEEAEVIRRDALEAEDAGYQAALQEMGVDV